MNEFGELDNQLEEAIDKFGLARLVNRIIEVCYAKEQHVRENWQDRELAESWRRAAAMLTTVEAKLDNEVGLR